MIDTRLAHFGIESSITLDEVIAFSPMQNVDFTINGSPLDDGRFTIQFNTNQFGNDVEHINNFTKVMQFSCGKSLIDVIKFKPLLC